MLPPGNALRRASPLLVVVVLVMLAGATAFAAWQAHGEPPHASHATAALVMARSGGSGLPSMTSMPATPENPGSGRAPLSSDAGGEEDGTGDAFEAFAVVALWVLLLLVGWLLLAFWDGPAKPSSIYLSALERPG